MKFEKVHNRGQARLFESQFFEALTKANPLVIWSMYLPFVIGGPVYLYYKFDKGALWQSILFVVGMFSWLFEYLAHRFAFHWIGESRRAQKFVYILHGNHHHYPRDRERLFMPPLPSIILASAIFGIQYPLLGNNAFAFTPGFILGYLLYASMHYAIRAWNPPFKWLKPLWRNHHLHHYKDENRGFGVSSTLWDHVFGTMFDLKNIPEDKQKVQGLVFKKEEADVHL